MLELMAELKQERDTLRQFRVDGEAMLVQLSELLRGEPEFRPGEPLAPLMAAFVGRLRKTIIDQSDRIKELSHPSS